MVRRKLAGDKVGPWPPLPPLAPPMPNIVSYNTIISGYRRYENGQTVRSCFVKCELWGLCLGDYTRGFTVQFSDGRGFQLQDLILKIGLLHSNAILGTALIGLFRSTDWFVYDSFIPVEHFPLMML